MEKGRFGGKLLQADEQLPDPDVILIGTCPTK